MGSLQQLKDGLKNLSAKSPKAKASVNTATYRYNKF